MKIRAEKPQDRSRVATLLAQTYGRDGVKAIEIAANLRANKDALCLVAERENQPWAFAILTPVLVGKNKTLMLSPMAIDPLMRAEAPQFVDALEAYVADKGFKAILFHGSESDKTLFKAQKAQEAGCVEKTPLPEATLLVRAVAGRSISGEIELPAIFKK